MPIRAYNGFDPTFHSLHVGHLVPIYGLVRLQRAGGQPVALVGGATGLIGDPSGRSAERPLLDRAAVQANVHAIRDQLARYLDFAPGATQALVVNNLDWLGEVRLLDFLRDVGKHFTVPVHAGQGLGPGPDGQGPLLHRVQLHAPAGGRLRPPPALARRGAAVRRRRPVGQHHGRPGADPAHGRAPDADGREPAHGLAYPLLLSPSGAKFGKSETRRIDLARPGA